MEIDCVELEWVLKESKYEVEDLGIYKFNKEKNDYDFIDDMNFFYNNYDNAIKTFLDIVNKKETDTFEVLNYKKDLTYIVLYINEDLYKLEVI